MAAFAEEFARRWRYDSGAAGRALHAAWLGTHARAADFVDGRWDETERDRVASYLEQGLVAMACAGPSPCRFCGIGNGTVERTDGVYIWPEGLPHYIREHGVRPPVSVIRHIVSRPASLRPREDEDWWRTFQDFDDWLDENHGRPDEWWKARINRNWWITATLDW